MKIIAAVLVTLLFAAPVLAEEYKVRDAGDLVSLCSRNPSAVDYVAAHNFCHGYTIGAYSYYASVASADPHLRVACVKEPYPQRNAVIADFVAWSKTHPSFMKDKAVDTLFRFLAETFPCK